MSRPIRGRRGLIVLLIVAVCAVAGHFAPTALRRTAAFQVREVEVIGTRFLDPYHVVRAAGLHRAESLFGNVDAWRAGVRTLALVDEVRVRRTFPSKVTLEVREVAPVGLVAARTLRPVDARGRLMELDPVGELMDLPVITGAEIREGRLVGPSSAALVTVAGLARRAPEVADRISQVHLSGEAIRVLFRDGPVEAILPAAASSVQVTQLRLTLADLSARGELDRVRSIDVRFRDQVVVSFLDGSVSG